MRQRSYADDKIKEFELAKTVTIQLGTGPDSATLVLIDNVGPSNEWRCDPVSFLSASEGTWSQLLASRPVTLSTVAGRLVLDFDELNMFAPNPGQHGTALHYGDGATLVDQQALNWQIKSVS